MKKFFITGLVILLPLAVTVAVLLFIIRFLTQPFIGIVSKLLINHDTLPSGFYFLSQEQLILYTSRALILIALFAFTLLLGFIARSFFIHALFNLGDKIIHRIPIVKTVYKTTQDIIKTVFVSDKDSFKQVVMVPFPKDGIYALGLISRESPSICSDTINNDLISVLIPTTPNPTTGFLLMCKKQDLILVDMSPEDAIKYVVSCGVITPESKISQKT